MCNKNELSCIKYYQKLIYLAANNNKINKTKNGKLKQHR